MRIEVRPLSMSTVFKSNNVEKQNAGNYKSSAVKTLGIVSLLGLVGLSAYGISIINKKPPKRTFEALLKEKELIFKDNLLFDKLGKKFSGSLSRSTGKNGETGFEMIETQVFNNGILEEKTYKDCFDNELMGYFYKDGKIVAEVNITSGGKNKIFAFSKYNKEGRCVIIGDGLAKRKESVFEIFRNNKNFEKSNN